MQSINSTMEEKFEVERFLILDEMHETNKFLFYNKMSKIDNIFGHTYIDIEYVEEEVDEDLMNGLKVPMLHK